MPRRQAEPIAAVRIELADEPSAIPAVASSIADAGGRIRTLSVVRRTPGPPPVAEIELEVEGLSVLLTIDPERLSAPLVREVGNPATGEEFPHVYGPLTPDAVVATRVLHPPHAAPPESTVVRASGIELEVLAVGAAVRRLRVGEGDDAVEVVLGHVDPMTYRFAGGYLGAVVGRVANRLTEGRFTVDGETHVVPTNEGGNTLHGGFEGFDRMPWTVEERSDTMSGLR